MATHTGLLPLRGPPPTANFLLALAARFPPTRPFLHKYFSAAVRLPSDWMEVGEFWRTFGVEEGLYSRPPYEAPDDRAALRAGA